MLVVGGAGYVGSILVRRLLQRGRKVRVLDNLIYGADAIADVLDHPNLKLLTGDCRDPKNVAAAVRGVSAVVHLAAIVGDAACDLDPKTAVEVNYDATRILIDASRDAGVERLVFASSCSAYGISDGLIDETSALQPISVYAETKVKSEAALLGAAGPQFHPTILRFASVFGNSYRPRFDLIVNLLTAKAYNEGAITIFNGGQWRPFIHVKDVVEGILRVLDAPADIVSGQIYNLGDSRFNHTLSDVGDAICAAFPATQIEHIENSDRRDYRVSVEKIKNQLGFTCSLRLEDGIRELKEAFDSGVITDYRAVHYHNQRFLENAGVGVPAFLGGSPIFESRFRFIQPTLPPLEKVVELYRPAFSSGMITNADLVSRLEYAAAERLNVKHCVAVSSCTSGLMLLMKVLGLTGEVILPSFTFFATGHAVVWNGLRPVFADCHPETWNIDPADIERRLTEKTSAILAVHLYGNPCDIQGLERIARSAGVKLIFDAAHAFGAEYGARPVGQFGDAEVFSLTPTKLLVAGEGGLIATHDAVLARLLRSSRNYGDSGAYDPEIMGLNARMTEFNAALALAGLELVDRKIKRHNEIAAHYVRAFSTLPGLSFQHVRAQDVCTFKDFSILIDPERVGMTRDELGRSLLAENIETKKYFYPPLHRQKLYQQYYDPANPLPHTDRISKNVLSLPIYEALPESACVGIVRGVERIVGAPAAPLVHGGRS